MTPKKSATDTGGSSTATFVNPRDPAVAGLFYEQDPGKLAAEIDQYLHQADPKPVTAIRGLISPHAGYQYSGPVAAYGYKLLTEQPVKTVIILAPSHYARFDGASIADNDAFETPLGMVPVSPKAAELARKKPFIPEQAANVLMPGWWRSSQKQMPRKGEATPHTWEHSLEVQLPFLQQVLGSFELIPIILGDVDPAAVAERLAPLLDEETLVVASTDLSHYYPYETAQEMDLATAEAIVRLDMGSLAKQEACGKGPIMVLLHLALQCGWKAELLDLRNSGDTAGGHGEVVGYTSIAFYQPHGKSIPPKKTTTQSKNEFTEEDRAFLLDLARKSVEEAVQTGSTPKVDPKKIPPKLRDERACFVTLTERGQLRGCIGAILPEEPLWKAVISRAAAAAMEDPRFSPVTSKELEHVHIEISVLSIPQPLPFDSPEELLEKLRPDIDGVVLKYRWHSATFLPQVWKQLPKPERFLDQLSLKAGLPSGSWRDMPLAIETYQVEAFEEEG